MNKNSTHEGIFFAVEKIDKLFSHTIKKSTSQLTN